MNLHLGIMVCAAALLAACGGGGGAASAPATTLPAQTAAPSATPLPVASPTSVPTATPVPTLLPTSAPSPSTLVVSWTSAVLAAGIGPQTGAINLFAAGQTATLTASEPGYSGVFSVSACVGVTSPPVTVSNVAGSNASFLVTANNVAGSCKIVVGDASGQAVSIQATVTLLTGTFQ